MNNLRLWDIPLLNIPLCLGAYVMLDISSVVVPVPFRPQSSRCMDVGVSFRVTAEDTYHSFLETLEAVGLCFGGGISECGSVNGSVSRSDGTVLLDVDIFILQDIVDLTGDWGVVDMHPSVATVVF